MDSNLLDAVMSYEREEDSEEESEDVGEVLLPSSMEALKARVEQNLEILGKTPEPEESPFKLSELRKNFPQVVFSFNFFSHLRWCQGVH